MVGERFRDSRIDRAAVRRAVGLAPDDRAVLVVAGSWGIGDVLASVEAIGGSGEFHPITVCGTDERLQAELESCGFGTVIGWTDEMPALMTAADALVENAGGLTCMEAFAVGLPVITYLPIAGHGKDNAEMMARSGVNHYAATKTSCMCDCARSPRPVRLARSWSTPRTACSPAILPPTLPNSQGHRVNSSTVRVESSRCVHREDADRSPWPRRAWSCSMWV